MAELEEHDAGDVAPIKPLRLDFPEDLGPQTVHLSYELPSQLATTEVLDILQISLILSRPHHRETVFFTKVVVDEPANLILLLNCIRGTLLLFEGIFQVLLGTDDIFEFILQLEREVTDNPEEGREVLAHRVRILILNLGPLHLKLLRQIDDQREVLQGTLIDRPHGIVDEIGTQKQRQQEYPRVMILVLVEGADALGVDDEHLVGVVCVGPGTGARLDFEGFVPDPEALGARVDGGADVEARLVSRLIQQNPIQKKALACPILARHSNKPYTLISHLVRRQEFLGFGRHLKTYYTL